MSERPMKMIMEAIDREELASLTRNLVDIPSKTGSEREIAQYIVEWMEENGIKSFGQEIGDGRMNAVGILPGSGKGKSLSFNGHLDTSFEGGVEDLNILREVVPEQRPISYIKEDAIYGLGAVNDKGPIAAYLIAAKAIREIGAKIEGDIVLACVAGEIGKAQVDAYNGPKYRGKGVGTRHLVNSGMITDYAINTEPSAFGITWAMAGAAFFKISTTGRARYSSFTRRAGSLGESENAILKMIPVVEAIEEWGARFENVRQYEFGGGVIVPKVTIGAISGGAPYKPNFSPAVCSVYVDVRVPPGMGGLEVKDEIVDCLGRLGFEVEVEMFLFQRGYEAQGAEPLVQAISFAYFDLFGTDIPRIAAPYTSCWGDFNIYCEVGVPAVKIGPSPSISSYGEQVGGMAVDDLMKAARLYAATMIRVCGGDGN